MLAIIIPYYKLTFFEATLMSLANQTDKRFKVYIGDDASDEDCSLLLTKYKDTFDFVYKRFETNLGGNSLVKQWERCIALSGDEEWLMILGDDDFIGPNLVSSFYQHFEEFNSQSNVLRFAKQFIFEKTKTVSTIQEHEVLEMASDSFYKRIMGLTTSTLSEYIFTKEVYNKYSFYDYPLAWHSDDRAWIEFTENKPIYTINEALVTVRSSHINISGRSDNSKLKHIANLSFFRYLIKERLDLFNKKQVFRILSKYENYIKPLRAITVKDRLELLIYHLKYFESKVFIKFIKRSVKQLFENSNFGINKPNV